MEHNTPESYAELLKARGDIPIGLLRSIRDQIDGVLQSIDELDVQLGVPPAPNDPINAVIAALRSQYPEYKSLSDEELLRMFNVRKP